MHPALIVIIWRRNIRRVNHFWNYLSNFSRRRKMNLIILLSIPFVLMTIVTIYALVSERKIKKSHKPEAIA